MAMIIEATLIMVAAVASLMMNLENERCWLKATRLAIKVVIFNNLALAAKCSKIELTVDR